MNDGGQHQLNLIANSNNKTKMAVAAMTGTNKRPQQREMSQQRGPQQQQSILDCKLCPLSPSARFTTTNPFWPKSHHHHHHHKRPSGGDGEEKENEISHKKARLNKNDDDDDDVQIFEETIVKIKEAEELKNKRCQNVFKFLTVRGLMLMNTSSDTATGPPQPPSRKQRLATSLLRQIVPDMEKFRFHSTDTGTSSMDEWDKVLKQRLVTKFGPNCTDRLVTYKLHGGMKGITIQEDSSSSSTTTTSVKYVATTKVDIMIRTNGFGTTAKTVLTGVLTLHFGPDSALLDSVSWSTIPDTEEHDHTIFSSPSSLNIQRAPAPAPE